MALIREKQTCNSVATVGVNCRKKALEAQRPVSGLLQYFWQKNDKFLYFAFLVIWKKIKLSLKFLPYEDIERIPTKKCKLLTLPRYQKLPRLQRIMERAQALKLA